MTTTSQLADEIIGKLTVTEKAQLLSQVIWETTAINHLDHHLSKFLLADGPAGIRRLKDYFDEDIYNTKPSTAYPSPSTYASSWDPDLIAQIGQHIGKEALQEDVDTMLAPAINLKRSPLGGRNFEYYSEDPYLTSELATRFIQGIQATGIGACLKHFALNNQETRRMNINVQVDEQTLHELYLRAFEKPVKIGQPKMIMTAYNQVNSDYCASNPQLLDVLRKDWGFDGVIVTDCFAAHNLAQGLKHGLTLQMPGENQERITAQIQELLETKKLTTTDLNRAIKHNIVFALDAANERQHRQKYNREEHHNFARKVAEESMILLKNSDQTLPLTSQQHLLVVGDMAIHPHFQGGGSSHVNPYHLEQPLTELKQFTTNLTFAQGYQIDNQNQTDLIHQAVIASENQDMIVVFAGLPDLIESEGYDRDNLELPANQNHLIQALTATGKPVVVVLANGSVITMPWKDSVAGILESYLGGEAGASAIANILFGKVNPSGKLAETFPQHLSDNPSYLNFPGNQHTVNYGEGRFIGYKYYAATHKSVAFPFGFGLSYTTFAYHSTDTLIDSTQTQVTFDLTNTGHLAGQATAEVYTCYTDSISGPEPLQLAGFSKIKLAPNQTKSVVIKLDQRVFQTFDSTIHQWVLNAGHYHLFVGNASDDPQLNAEMTIAQIPVPVTADSNLGDMLHQPGMAKTLQSLFKKHPKSAEFLEMTKDDDPLKARSMGALMTFNTLKRVDATLDTQNINTMISIINQKGDLINANHSK
ncbi:glycosyl hydrolase [Lactobacillus sp. CBA3606]|uniref:beta-glucosidase n=1 Tax=Lactobacillus sp. CBA3606 TaxID=2099789 RepID=UPI000CFCA095|nr:glycoside hydrolase family 3 C-terminal domain-containing protein [Lactobacillus sp. CBA3606]AVK64108.1 glycosyl hydrolase [Lactobacillus sp. CBA3606]